MVVERTLAFDLNSLSLPRLLQEEVEVDLNRIPIMTLESGDTVVRFADLYDLSKQLSIPCSEAMELLREDHAIKGGFYAVVLETRFYDDRGYQQAVLESSSSTPMLIKSAGIDEDFDRFLAECIEQDLYMGTTEQLDALCEFLDMGELGMENKSVTATIDNVKAGVKGWFAKKLGSVAREVGPSIASKGIEVAEGMVDKHLGEGNNADQTGDKVAQFLGNTAEKAGKVVVDKAAQGMRQAALPHIRNALLAGGGLAIAGITKNQLDNLTNQEAIANANPGMAARMMNSLKGMLNTLVGKQQQASGNPQQQGLISRMIEKVKNAIRALGRKVGLVH